ncbi:MAG TPA: TonB-dependent receptor [Longimicrobiales bacterium]|nr:TonB-dependent receptor [Longimicrobiales bacterium]
MAPDPAAHAFPPRPRRRPLPRGLLLLAGMLAWSPAGPLEAQSAGLEVRIRTDGGPVPEALVEVLYGDVVLGSALSDDAGVARVRGLAVGTFRVRVAAYGFATRIIPDVRVIPGEAQILDVELASSPIAVEGLTVRAERIRIRRENMEFSSLVDESTILLMPVAREVNDLIALTPGARPGHIWGGANFQANNYRIDGLSANHPGMGGDLLKPSVNWIDRLEVRGLGSGAEYGGFQGGLIDVVTKRGNNTFQGFVRSSFEHEFLSASNLVATEIGREVAGRVDLEAEVRGPLIRDRLFYYLAGEYVAQDLQALNHLRWVEGRLAPMEEGDAETKLFGKLTWTPVPSQMLEVSGAYTDLRADNYGITGYEGVGAAHRYSAPTWFVNGAWTAVLGDHAVLEARANHFSRDERHDPYAGEDVPGIRTFSLTPPYTAFGNAPLTLRSAPSSTSATLQGTFQAHTGALEHTLKVGAEYTRGSFLDRRIRNGGMTWLPANTARFDPDDPATWPHVGSEILASKWGGEVHLDAETANEAAYAQATLSLGPRIMLTPGIRWNRWTGWLTPRTGDRFQAVQDQGLDPRVGISVALTGDGSFVAKAHWGRYHQSLISQMFDRVAGADVFTNEEFWYYQGGPFADPTTAFTREQRDALAEQGLFRKDGEIVLNEMGPVEDYRQPYVDQWLVGLEKEVSTWLKVEAVYTRRTNRDMVALVDRNRATNYTRFERVRVFDPGGGLVPFAGGSVYLQELWVPNHTIIERLRCLADQGPCTLPVPGMELADTLWLTWDPDYVLTTAPDARREFSQVQVSMEINQPLWGATFSVVTTDLEGNLDNVSGYDDPSTYSAGPYVRVNEGVNSSGTLENFADVEVKVSAWGTLPWDLRGGAFWTIRSGDHYSPRFQLYGLGFFTYRVDTGALLQGLRTERPGQALDYMLMGPLEGHSIFVGPRGAPTLKRQSILDLRVERMFDFRGRELSVSLDAFNVLGSQAVTDLNTMVNNGPDYGFPVSYSLFSPGIAPNQYYEAPLERVAPRSFRIGIAAYF